MSVPIRSNDSLKRSENSKINGVNIQDGGALNKVIQGILIKKARKLSGSLSSVKKEHKEDERSLKHDDQLSNSDSFTSNFDEVFDSPQTNEIPEDYKVAHPYNIPTKSNPYIQRYNVNTPGKNPFMSQSSNNAVEKLVDITEIPCKNNEPLTPLRASKPCIIRTPSIKLHTPEPSKCISLAPSRAVAMRNLHHSENDNPMPMPRTNPNHARFNTRGSKHDGTPFRYPGDGEHSPTSESSERFKPLHPVLSRSNTDNGSLYQLEINGEQDVVQKHKEGAVPKGAAFDTSFNLIDVSPASNEPLMDLGSTPVDLGTVFAASNTPQNEVNGERKVSERPIDVDIQNNHLSVQPRKEVLVDVTPAPTVCSSNYQAQLGSGLSAENEMNRNIARDSVSSCQTHRLDFYQPPNPQEVKSAVLRLKIAYGFIIIGGCVAIAAIIALFVEDPLDIM